MRRFTLILVLLFVAASSAAAQTAAVRQRARVQSNLGWEDMRAEAFEKAVKSFQNAIAIDPTFEVPYYGLGRAFMALKNFNYAIVAYEKCRELYRGQAGKQFTDAQEAQRYRQDRITEIDDQLRQAQSGPQTPARQEMVRQMQNVRRDITENIQRGNNNLSMEMSVPAWVSLGLGSAYFRSGRLRDAEQEYKNAIAADGKAGEAHSNLAVVYLETGRYAEASASLSAAKKAGFKVMPELEKAVREKAK
ncbi:MAG TPA: tetratricopeptide repeat protein [Vicinamibacterales bacterium]